MEPEEEKLVAEMERKMKLTVHTTAEEFASVRTGRANPALVEKIQVDCYGTHLPLNQVATITTPEPRLILIAPWDKQVSSEIVRALSRSDLGLVPVSDGNVIRLPVPPLTEERRKEMAKLVAKRAEHGKVSIRNLRRETKEELKRMEKELKISEDEIHRVEGKIQEITDKHIEEIDKLCHAKQAEVMEV